MEQKCKRDDHASCHSIIKERRRSRSNSLPGWTSFSNKNGNIGSNTTAAYNYNNNTGSCASTGGGGGGGHSNATCFGMGSLNTKNSSSTCTRSGANLPRISILNACVGAARNAGSCRSDQGLGQGQGGQARRCPRSDNDKGYDVSKTCWWEPDREDTCDTVDFALETSLHGLKYICQPRRHLIERIYWMIAFLIGMVLAGWLISNVWLTYLNTPLIVTFQPVETTIDKIPFPAITICNMNKVLKSKAEEYIRNAHGADFDEKTIEARKNVYYLHHVCSSSKSFSQKFNLSSKRGAIDPKIIERTGVVEDGDDEQRDVAQFLQLASQPCSDMLLLCAWQDEIYNCSDLFKPVETDFGKCCTFNMIPHRLLYKTVGYKRYDPYEVKEWAKWDIEKYGLLLNDNDGSGRSKVYPRRQKRAGKSSGLSVLLNPDLEEYFCTSSDSHGFQLVKHLPIDIPKVVDFGIAIRPNSEVFMGIRPEITMADRDVQDFKLEKRNCYFHGEYQLAYYKHYTSPNCYDECLANKTYEICGCVSYYMPRDDTRDLCGASNFGCAETVRKSALHTGIKSKCDFCLPACTELEYFSETTFTPLQHASNIWGEDSNITANWADKNLSIVHIYFSSDSTYARVRKELYGVTDLIAKTGGLMGLCLGFSGLSLIELLYFYTLRAWCRTRRRRSMWSIVALKFHRLWLRSKVKQTERRYSVDDTVEDDVDDIIKMSGMEKCYPNPNRAIGKGGLFNSNRGYDDLIHNQKPYYFVPETPGNYYRGCGCRLSDSDLGY